MSKRLRYSLLLLLLALVMSAVGIWMLPQVVAALPGQVRGRLPEEFLRLVTTPLPTALPAPAVSASGTGDSSPARISIPTLVPPTATATVTATPTPAGGTAVPTAAASPTLQPTATPTPTPSPPPPPPAARLEGLEITPQKLNNCGPTNLSITLNFYGHETTQLDVAEVVKPNYEDRNVSPWELTRYVNERTPLRATVHSGGDLTLLKRLVAAGFPVVIEKGLHRSEWEGWMGHYLTIFGYDDAREEFYSMDTFLGPWDGSGRSDTYDAIAERWQHFNYTFFVVYPPEREEVVHDILGSQLLDATAMWQNAAVKAQAATDVDPENAFAWFNLGTSLTHLGQISGEADFYRSAAAAFDRARAIGLPWRMLWYQFQPYVAYLEVGRLDDVFTLVDATLSNPGGRNVEETYLYQGHALLASGDTAGATAAYQRAAQLNPNFTPAQEALDSLPQQ